MLVHRCQQRTAFLKPELHREHVDQPLAGNRDVFARDGGIRFGPCQVLSELSFRLDSAVHPLATGKGQHDGVEPTGDGRLLVTSWADSSLNIVESGQYTRLAGGIPSPADLGWDPKTRRAAIPLLMAGRVEIWELPK